MIKAGILYIVATPIGNYKDITLRALETLQSVDAVICEEARIGTTLLKRLDIPAKEIVLLNEHNEMEQAGEIVKRLWQDQSMALITDCGTPTFADPGAELIRQTSEAGIPVVPVPGPSSLMTAISLLDTKLEQFVFGGFLPRQPESRRHALVHLRNMRMPIILMDTPYRMATLLEEVSKNIGNRRALLACDLTAPEEKIYRGTIDEIRKSTGGKKSEFILIIY